VDIYKKIEQELQYEELQKENIKLYTLSHDIGITFSKFKAYFPEEVLDEDDWIMMFEGWCHYLKSVKEKYRNVEAYKKELDLNLE
jgi:hypothetical protein